MCTYLYICIYIHTYNLTVRRAIYDLGHPLVAGARPGDNIRQCELSELSSQGHFLPTDL